MCPPCPHFPSEPPFHSPNVRRLRQPSSQPTSVVSDPALPFSNAPLPALLRILSSLSHHQFHLQQQPPLSPHPAVVCADGGEKDTCFHTHVHFNRTRACSRMASHLNGQPGGTWEVGLGIRRTTVPSPALFEFPFEEITGLCPFIPHLNRQEESHGRWHPSHPLPTPRPVIGDEEVTSTASFVTSASV